MAGRGTDIKLGGNKDFIVEGISSEANEHKKNELKVKDAGGLFVTVQRDTKVEELTISLEVDQEDRRPWVFNFFISLQDELMKFLVETN